MREVKWKSLGHVWLFANCLTIAFISHACKVILKILQAKLQWYMNQELPDVYTGFRKGRGTKDQITNICRIIEKASKFQKNIYYCFIAYAKTFDCVDHHKLWKILKEIRLPDHLTPLLRNLYACQETTVKIRHGATDWFKIEKGVCQVYIMSPCLFNLYANYIMQNAGLEELQAGIKIARKNIKSLRYADGATLIAERTATKEPLDEGERGELKSWLTTQPSKHEDHGIWSHHFMTNRRGESVNSDKFYFLGLQNHCRWWLQPACSLEGKLQQT